MNTVQKDWDALSQFTDETKIAWLLATALRLEGDLNAAITETEQVREQHQSIECAARAVASHWNEFGYEHGFEEAIHRLERLLDAIKANQEKK